MKFKLIWIMLKTLKINYTITQLELIKYIWVQHIGDDVSEEKQV